MPGVAPLLPRLDDHDSTRNDVSQAARAERDDSMTPQESAARGVLLDGQRHQFGRTTEIEIARGNLVLALRVRRCGDRGGFDAQPFR